MKFNEIREAFPRCGVTVSQDGVSLVFKMCSPPRWINESIDDDIFKNIGVFRNLVYQSKAIHIKMCPGDYVGFLFGIPMPNDTDLIFQPLEKQRTVEEENQIISDIISNRPVNQDFLDSFHDVNLENESEVFNAFVEFSKKTDKGVLLSLDSIKQWEILKEASAGFIKSAKFGEVSIEPPSKDIDFGTVEFYMEAIEPKIISIYQKNMEDFRKMVFAASGFDISSNIEPGFAGFVLDVFS